MKKNEKSKTTMRKTSEIWLAAAVLLLAGCTADEPAVPQEERVPVSLTVSQVEMQGATRAGIDVQATQFDQAETFYAYFPEHVTVGEATTASHTTFTTTDTDGNTSPATQPWLCAAQATVHAYYPATVTNATTAFTVAADQSTDAGYKASDLMYATAELTKTGSTVTGDLAFDHRMAKITANVTAGTGISTITDVRIIGGCRTIDIVTPLSCTLGATLTDANSTDSYINMYSGSAATASTSALIPPQTVSGGFLQIVTDKGAVTYSLNSKTFAPAQNYTLNLTINLASIGTTVAITGWTETQEAVLNVETAVFPPITPPGLEAVDIGLYVGGADSGTKLLFANMNVGAQKPTDYGTYFAWGEVYGYTVYGSTTSPVEGNAKTIFNWSTYSFCRDGDYNYMLKYCTNADHGVVDNLTQLMPQHDAAYVNWMGNWRMPTYEEMKALDRTFYNPDYVWELKTDYNGIPGCNGWLITYKGVTPNTSLFFPFAGVKNSAVANSGGRGYYWTSSLYEDYDEVYGHMGYWDELAWIIEFSHYVGGGFEAMMEWEDRSLGCTIRAVMPAED